MSIVRKRHPYPLKYSGSLFFLILFSLCWPPLGLFLFIKNAQLVKESSLLYLRYRGKWGWIIFWAIFFFPIAVILMLIRGADVMEEKEKEN